ncbi:MAG: ATPase, partial [Cypionkella sp.]
MAILAKTTARPAMNMHPQIGITPPPEPRTLRDLGLSGVVMRDIALKTIFRTHLAQISDIARALALPIGLTQELIEALRAQTLIEAMGTLSASASAEMGYQLTDAG